MGSKRYCFFCSVMYILKPFSIYDFRAENGLKNAKSKSTGIISSKNTVAGQKDLIKWPNVLGPTLQSLVTLLAFQQKSKREKSNLSVQTVLPQEKKLKLCENVVGKSRKISGDNRNFWNPQIFFSEKRFQKKWQHYDYRYPKLPISPTKLLLSHLKSVYWCTVGNICFHRFSKGQFLSYLFWWNDSCLFCFKYLATFCHRKIINWKLFKKNKSPLSCVHYQYKLFSCHRNFFFFQKKQNQTCVQIFIMN